MTRRVSTKSVGACVFFFAIVNVRFLSEFLMFLFLVNICCFWSINIFPDSCGSPLKHFYKCNFALSFQKNYLGDQYRFFKKLYLLGFTRSISIEYFFVLMMNIHFHGLLDLFIYIRHIYAKYVLIESLLHILN